MTAPSRCAPVLCETLALLVGAILIGLSPSLSADEPKTESSHWVRVLRDDDQRPLALETASVRYTSSDSANPIQVDLVAAIHVGDRAYYESLNKRFEQYDALLYELVAPPGTKVPRGQRAGNRHPVSAMQNGLKSFLELEHQLEIVDYSAKNFVHADMSPAEFAKRMNERGESFLQMLFKLMGSGIAQQSKQNAESRTQDVDLVMALFDEQRPLKLKRILAAQFEDMESALAGFSGPDGSTIITERNKAALEVLAEQVKAGKKKIGIFYGAGHMDDMSRRLTEEFKLAPARAEWVEAWNLRDPRAVGK